MSTEHELELRQELHDLVDGPPPVSLSSAAVLARARRRRLLRGAGVGGSAAAAVVLALTVPQLMPGGGHGSAPASPPTSTAPSPRSTAVVPGVPQAGDPVHMRLGPAHPRVGVGYPYDLLTHCGIEYAPFGGRNWRAVNPQPDPGGVPVAGTNNTYYSGIRAGTMTLLTPDLARFTTPGLVPIDFRPMAGNPPLCA